MPSAIASSDAKNCRCAAATSRIAATSGSKARESVERSPGSERPISPTIHSGARGRLTTDIGNPIWLFWLPGVFSTAKRRASIAAVKSLVVVFPAEPVIAARRKPIFFFAATPRLRSASTDCGTITVGNPAGSPSAPALAEQRPGAPRGRVPREVVAVHARAADRDEEVARSHLARVDRDARQRRRALGPGPGGRRDFGQREVHARPA